MNEIIDPSLIDWSRAQFALTAMYHWLFVPLTLGLGLIMALMETAYYVTGDLFWKRTVKFWMKLFGINFAIGVATGIILEFEFGTNWSNYSWFVGDIFGAPLAIEGILAFFMESTFVAVMYFGWNKVSKKFHLASTWLTIIGATLSAWWILVANAWMQYPVGMEFNPDTVRNEMNDFMAVAFSPVAINKFIHTVLSGWVLGAAFVAGISFWFLLKKRETEFAVASLKIAAWFGLTASVLCAIAGDGSAYNVGRVQPMKLAAMEALYEGHTRQGLIALGVVNPDKVAYNDSVPPVLLKLEIPNMLSWLVGRNIQTFVPGIKDIIDGGYPTTHGPALSTAEKIKKGRIAVDALAHYREAVKEGNADRAQLNRNLLKENYPYFGYGYINKPEELIPNVPLNFYAFRVMVGLGSYFILFFALVLIACYKNKWLSGKFFQWVGILTIPLAYIAGEAGWIVAESGRQPWAIQDVLPNSAAISRLGVSSVQTTFFVFVVLFAVLLIAEIRIMLREIKKGPEGEPV
ncbi:MAG: cytochrome ubiquinol oxidase subunit I [Bacteroidales bacterium]|nr:cytochrome ubiquinol oxidase subunit I [Bacteroidales bacterium]